MEKYSIEEGSEILSILQSLILSLDDLDSNKNCLCLILKNGLIRDFKKLSYEISLISDDGKTSIKSIHIHLTQICLFIMGKFSALIEYYNIFLNCLLGKIKNYLWFFLSETCINDNDYLTYFKIYSIYYKLIENYWKEWNNFLGEKEFKPSFSTKLKSRAFFFFNNFTLPLISYSKKNDYISDNFPRKFSQMAYYKILERKKQRDDYTYYNTDYLTTSKYKGPFIIELYVYLNAKLHKWKSTIIKEEEIMKCRICEKDFTLNSLIIHSNTCKIKHDYSKQVILINNEIKEIISDPKFNLVNTTWQIEQEIENIDFNNEDNSYSPLAKSTIKTV